MIESKSKIASLEESNAYIQKILNSMKLFWIVCTFLLRLSMWKDGTFTIMKKAQKLTDALANLP